MKKDMSTEELDEILVELEISKTKHEDELESIEFDIEEIKSILNERKE